MKKIEVNISDEIKEGAERLFPLLESTDPDAVLLGIMYTLALLTELGLDVNKTAIASRVAPYQFCLSQYLDPEWSKEVAVNMASEFDRDQVELYLIHRIARILSGHTKEKDKLIDWYNIYDD